MTPPAADSMWSLAQPDLLWLSALAPALVAIAWLGIWRARRRLRQLADHDLLERIAARPRWGMRGVRAVLIGFGVLALAAAAAGPRSDPESIELEREGREICIVLDLSRSMLAEDLAPNRLERSKLWIRDLVADRPDARFALIGFAGTPSVLSPLTLDHVFFDLALEEAGPRSVARGGTNLGDAIRRAITLVFDDPEPDDGGTRDIILITDGEDQGSFPVEAAAEAGRRGIRILTLGIGGDGATIPSGRGVVMQGNEPVRTRLDAQTLADIATSTPGGVILNVGTGTIRLDRVYDDLSTEEGTSAFETAEITVWRERYLLALVPALLLLVLERLLPQSRRMPA